MILSIMYVFGLWEYSGLFSLHALFNLTLIIADYLVFVSVARRICEQESLTIANHKVYITRASCSSPKKESSAESESRDTGLAVTEAGDSDSVHSRTIFVDDVPLDMVEFLELHLESEKKGGGAIKKLRQRNGGILVTFEQSEGMM